MSARARARARVPTVLAPSLTAGRPLPPPFCSAAAYREHIVEAERLQGLAVSRLEKHAAARRHLAEELEALQKPRPPPKRSFPASTTWRCR